MTDGGMEYKGKRAKLIMMGTKENFPGWKGELFTAVVQYGDEDDLSFDVVPDSTEPSEIDELPEVKTFTNRSQAVTHFMKLEQNKKKWKHGEDK